MLGIMVLRSRYHTAAYCLSDLLVDHLGILDGATAILIPGPGSKVLACGVISINTYSHVLNWVRLHIIYLFMYVL